jgi:hypothetical protein
MTRGFTNAVAAARTERTPQIAATPDYPIAPLHPDAPR